MSLKQALECIYSELTFKVPLELDSVDKEQEIYKTKGFKIEIIDYFSFMPITERRLKRSSEISIETRKWLQANYDFLKQIQDDEKDSLWFAYLLDLENDRMITFLINTKQNTYVKASYLLPEMYPRNGELWDGK